MPYPVYIFLALAPSLIWLMFYLGKDAHPESKKIILRVFIYGAIIALPAALIEMLLEARAAQLNMPPLLYSIIYFFLIVALVEEVAKYFAAKYGALTSSEIDEPVDIMEYMIVSALGFAALENLLYLYGFTVPSGLILAMERFVGATFLHALASGVMGYFIILYSINTEKPKIVFLILGLAVATTLHGLFNFSIIEIDDLKLKLAVPLGLLMGLALFISWCFKKAKTMKGVCKIT